VVAAADEAACRAIEETEIMLMNAVHRTMQDAAAAFALLVDAKNDLAAGFYRRYGFRPIAGKPRTLFLPLATAQKTLL